ncbi:GntR family transcriptional regulator [Nonomuraea mesophila]|uniref:GntR family transcriptional regulator n=1 Tax=Nonomuraea mesophila TaxID=2530382 RepID=A0A4R5FE79_9ACTN|nr:GntR family transcriptional regulator [Nonomuraea mesophila]TDE48457.1 GntR family transcriptional regulator [Nonomuraea mesophila]
MTDIDWARRLALEPGAAVPLYYQLRERLRAVISECEPDTPIPAEKDLMAFAGVSRATARRAIGDLVQEGLLVARQGSGTYTAPAGVTSELGSRPAGFTETMARLGRKPTTRVLEARVQPCAADLAPALGLEAGAGIVFLERIRLLDDEPCMIESAHLPAELVPGILDEDLTGSLYGLLRLKYGLSPASGKETIGAVNADYRLAGLLHVPMAAALLATARSTVTEGGLPLEYTIRHARGDLTVFSVELNDAKNALMGQGPR